jgi:hypothetical protein
MRQAQASYWATHVDCELFKKEPCATAKVLPASISPQQSSRCKETEKKTSVRASPADSLPGAGSNATAADGS